MSVCSFIGDTKFDPLVKMIFIRSLCYLFLKKIKSNPGSVPVRL